MILRLEIRDTHKIPRPGEPQPLLTVTVNLKERSYPIHLGAGLLNQVGELARTNGIKGKVGIVTNPVVAGLYLDQVETSLTQSGYETVAFVVPDGEEHKNFTSLNNLYDQLIEHRFDRSSTLMALGGGVIGDLTGFAAATFLRGINFIQLPTTLLAQVDASVGGKTAVNHQRGKNLIGAFYQPRMVVIDVQTLETLSTREYVAGISEVIKYGVIEDANFFVYLEDHLDQLLHLEPDVVERVIATSCRIKAMVVEQDERENDRRAILNFGHTLGHALESFTNYERFLHGEGVAIGMVQAAILSAQEGLCTTTDLSRLERLVRAAGLPWQIPRDIGVEQLLGGLEVDKKSLAGKIKFVLCSGIGATQFQWLTPQEILHRLAP